jgi:hypothetical protein
MRRFVEEERGAKDEASVANFFNSFACCALRVAYTYSCSVLAPAAN